MPVLGVVLDALPDAGFDIGFKVVLGGGSVRSCRAAKLSLDGSSFYVETYLFALSEPVATLLQRTA